MPLPPSHKAGLRAGRQIQVESAKSRLQGRPKSIVENGFKPFLRCTQLGVFQQLSTFEIFIWRKTYDPMGISDFRS
jgi:hypothetical protein